VDLIREPVRVALQELIEAEATERIGAAPYKRTESRVTERNGHRTRSLSTKAGDVDLRIPKLRKNSFFPGKLTCDTGGITASTAASRHRRSTSKPTTPRGTAARDAASGKRSARCRRGARIARTVKPGGHRCHYGCQHDRQPDEVDHAAGANEPYS
jgi:hypothetical protein